MKSIAWIAVGCLCLTGALLGDFAAAQGPPRNDRKAGAAAAKELDLRARELAVIRQSAQAFSEAFNRGDAKAVAALWTKDGEYIDELGNRFVGRDAIEKEYTNFFAAHPGAKITVVVDSLRLASDNTAIEDGRAVVQLGRVVSRGYGEYTTVHVKIDGKWLMSSVRDTRSAVPAGGDQVQDLDWLVGSWSAEENSAKMDVDCRWIADKHFLERTYSVKRGDQVFSSGTQIIGWNPQSQQIQSWTFTSDGGHALGTWEPRKDGWTVEMAGIMADGTPTLAVNIITRLDDGALSWQSVERSAGGVKIPDAEEVLLKRVTAKR